ISTETQFLTAPSRSADIELKTQIGVHGPKELHFVLIDNGRTAMREDPACSEALRCIKCGACSNVCPTYQVVGGHVFGHIYTGPIGLVVSPFHHGLDSVAYEQQMCVGCNACDTVCPVGIPIASLITDVRALAVQRTGLSWAKRIALSQWTSPQRIRSVFGHIYTGPIGLVVSPFHHGLDSVAYEQQMCVGCNACDTVCPVGIPIASLITDVRALAVQRTGISWAKRIALSQWTSPQRIDRMTGWLSALQGPLRHGSLVRLPFGDLGKEKSLPAVAQQPLHYRAREITQTNPTNPVVRVGLFPSCIVDHFLPGAGYAAARTLQALGADVHIVEGRRCCGLPH